MASAPLTPGRPPRLLVLPPRYSQVSSTVASYCVTSLHKGQRQRPPLSLVPSDSSKQNVTGREGGWGGGWGALSPWGWFCQGCCRGRRARGGGGAPTEGTRRAAAGGFTSCHRSCCGQAFLLFPFLSSFFCFLSFLFFFPI